MTRNVLLLCLLLLLGLVVTSCQSRRSVTPQPLPPAAAEAERTVPVTSGDSDFQPAVPETRSDVLSADITEASRMARQQGLIQDAFFAFDASTLDSDAQEALRRSATWLRDNAGYRIRVEGHCDERGTEQYNLALGDRRADTAASYLSALGIDRRRIETQSYGEERPFELGSYEAAWQQNRRAHLVLTR